MIAKNGVDFTELNEKMKVELRNMALKHLACQESELVMQSFGMCEPFGGIDKVEEIIKTVDEAENNFTCSDEELDYYIFHRDEVDDAHKAKLKKLKVFEGVPQAECPKCGTLSPLTVTKCPNCGVQFEKEE